MFNEKIKTLLETHILTIMSILYHDPEILEEIQTMHGQNIKPLKPTVMKIVEMLNLLLKIEDLKKLEEIFAKKDIFGRLWVNHSKFFLFFY